MPAMAPSRTNEEQTVLEKDREGRVSDMDFSTGSEVPSDEVTAAPARDSKTVDERAFPVVTDDSRDALLTEFGNDTLRDR